MEPPIRAARTSFVLQGRRMADMLQWQLLAEAGDLETPQDCSSLLYVFKTYTLPLGLRFP